ncbi:MAG: Crp/Fnr family transcriptional regulator [Rhodocyclaceae bacterium]|nr:Crp/Fnr family transcriptional regulator [Rhodocyclaceae bacterium]
MDARDDRRGPKHPIPEQKRRGRSNCGACALREVMVCSDVTVDELADFHTWIDDLAIPSGGIVFNMDAPADGVYCIRAGIVKLVKYSSSGAQRIVRIIKRSDVAGMEAVFSDSFEHTAIAVGDVVACRIPVANFRRMIEANPTLQRRLLEKSQHALREAETWLSELAGGTAQARERMARLLLRLREGHTERIHRFSLEDIGAMLGITVETASRILADFTRMGLLTKHSAEAAMRYYTADIAGLERIVDGSTAVQPEAPATPRVVRFDN